MIHTRLGNVVWVYNSFYFLFLILLTYSLLYNIGLHLKYKTKLVHTYYCTSFLLYVVSVTTMLCTFLCLIARLFGVYTQLMGPFDLLYIVFHIVGVYIVFLLIKETITKNKGLVILDSQQSPSLSFPVGNDSCSSHYNLTGVPCSPLERDVISWKIIKSEGRGLIFQYNQLVQYQSFLNLLEIKKIETQFLLDPSLHNQELHQLFLQDTSMNIREVHQKYNKAFDIQKKLSDKHFIDMFLETDRYYKNRLLSDTGIDSTVLSNIIPTLVRGGESIQSFYLGGNAGMWKPLVGFRGNNLEGLSQALSHHLPDTEASGSVNPDYDSERTLTDTGPPHW